MLLVGVRWHLFTYGCSSRVNFQCLVQANNGFFDIVNVEHIGKPYFGNSGACAIITVWLRQSLATTVFVPQSLATATSLPKA
jgi:hypothetical protein